MKRVNSFVVTPIIAMFILLIGNPVKAQSAGETNDLKKLRETIQHSDDLLWKYFNTCDLKGMRELMANDLEFYHDKHGLTVSAEKVIQSMKTGACGNENLRLRREVVEGSVKIFPINGYGAVQTGEHRFYVTSNGKKERLDAEAKFTHIWHYKDKAWKMSRIISYDHQSPGNQAIGKVVTLPKETLAQYSGKYQAPHAGEITLSVKDGGIEIQTAGGSFQMRPISEIIFSHESRNLKIEFIKDKNGIIKKMVIRENGEIVEEARRLR